MPHRRINIDVEESGHSKAGIVWNVDLEKVNENQLDWTSIQSRGFGHGGWKQKLDEHHPTKQKNWLGHVLRNESLLRTVLEGRMEGTRTRGRHSDTMIDWMKSNDVEYDSIKKRAHDRKDWRQLEAWTCLKRQSTQERESNYGRIFNHLWDIQHQRKAWSRKLGYGLFKVIENGAIP